MAGIDPISLATSATQFGIGALQSLLGGGKARRAQKQLENLKTPTYTPNKSILDYYNTALQRYNINPYQSQQYQAATGAANANEAAGIGALNSRQSAVGGVSRLAALTNNAYRQAGVSAENEQNQRFSQLGGATQMKTADDLRGFQYNQLAPYEKKYNLLAMKAGANAQTANAGIQNMFGALGGLQDYSLAKKMYGTNNYNFGNNGGGGGDTYSPSYQQAKQYGLLNP